MGARGDSPGGLAMGPGRDLVAGSGELRPEAVSHLQKEQVKWGMMDT